jgi:hypothetical protein
MKLRISEKVQARLCDMKGLLRKAGRDVIDKP